MTWKLQKGLLASLCLLLAACSSQPDAGSAGNGRGYTQTGLASYYADHYHNKRTASGEPYQKSANTAAHMTLTGIADIGTSESTAGRHSRKEFL